MHCTIAKRLTETQNVNELGENVSFKACIVKSRAGKPCLAQNSVRIMGRKVQVLSKSAVLYLPNEVPKRAECACHDGSSDLHGTNFVWNLAQAVYAINRWWANQLRADNGNVDSS